ncbi:MAG TPA: hypothetical protein VIZ62_03645 [Nitrososphaeraceae archaeon]
MVKAINCVQLLRDCLHQNKNKDDHDDEDDNNNRSMQIYLRILSKFVGYIDN